MHVPAPVNHSHRAVAKPSSVVRILLVEDSKGDVFLIEHELEDSGLQCFYEIVDVPRLVDAFRRIDHESFDLIILDLNLLDIDGVSAVAALRAQVPDVPIVVHSGREDAKTKASALLCGATHYLVKGQETGLRLKQIIETLAM